MLSKPVLLINKSATLDKEKHGREEAKDIDKGTWERNGYCNVEHRAGKGQERPHKE